jgi:hypothetical protein
MFRTGHAAVELHDLIDELGLGPHLKGAERHSVIKSSAISPTSSSPSASIMQFGGASIRCQRREPRLRHGPARIDLKPTFLLWLGGRTPHGEDGVSGSRDVEGIAPALVNSTVGPLIAYAPLAVVFFFISFAQFRFLHNGMEHATPLDACSP